MKAKEILPGIVPIVIAVLLFLILSFAYFPDVLDGKQLSQHDNLTFKGMSKEIVDFREETGEEPLWTNSMFGGMPAYMISTRYKGNLLSRVDRILKLGPRPVSFLFLYLIGFFILLLAFRVNPWLAIAGAIAFAFSSYNFSIIAAGHNSKAIAIGYMAPVIAGIIYTFRGKRILGAAITGVFLSLQVFAGHPQITYYTLIVVFVFGLFQLYFAIRENYFKDLLITVTILVVTGIIGVAGNSDRILTTMEYSKYTMRSQSELTARAEDQTSGLSKSYATGWSYGVDETFTLLIPNFKGGSNDGSLSENSETYRLFAQNNPAQASEVIKHLPLYWGTQPSTLGPFYVGAIVIFLFVLGMFILDKRTKWWLFAATVLAIMLSWGRNFMFLTNLFLDYVPGYNKFRTVTMTLVIADLAMPLVAILAVNKVLFGDLNKKQLNDALKWSVGIIGGLALIFALLPDLAGDFVSARDSNMQPAVADAFQADRRNILRLDALRSLVFILLPAGLILRNRINRLKVNLAITVLAILFLVDMWPINKRYLNKTHFSNKREASQPFTPSAADQFIMNDPGSNNRVLNLTVPVFQDASTSYFHQSVGGYHGAKMRRYQDLIDTRLTDDFNTLIKGIQSQDIRKVDSTLELTNILNMINMKYILLNPETQPIINRHAKGNAWFVSEVEVVENADADVKAVAQIDLDKIATLDKRFEASIDVSSLRKDTAAQIRLSDYQPNKLVYHSSSSTRQLAVFSEVYYEEGWQATIDGENANHLRVNYLLRGMVIPEGEHEIVFNFRPQSYYAGQKISKISSLLLIFIFLGAVYLNWKKGNKDKKSLITV